MTKKRIIIIAMLLAATAARAFDFRVATAAGQYVYYNIIAGTTTVKVVNPDWDSYTPPTGFLALPSTVTHGGVTYQLAAIDIQAFRDCSSLTGISVPEGVTSIGRMAFAFCTLLDSIVLPSTLTEIGTMAFTGTAFFSDNSRLTDDGLLFIGSYVIAARSDISEAITVPEGTLGLGNMAFYSCEQMPKTTLPSSLHFIGENAFSDCLVLDTVRLLGTVPPTLASNSFVNVTDFVVAVPCGEGETYQAAPNWSALTIVEMCDTASPHDTVTPPPPPPVVPVEPTVTEHPQYPRFPEVPHDDDSRIIEPVTPEPRPVGIEEIESTQFAATAVEGGLSIVLPEGYSCTVRNVLGRAIATLQKTGFVPLRNSGVYLVENPLTGKAVKVMFHRN